MPNRENSPVQSKVWFITGANRGLGAAITRAALRAGHRVVASGRDANLLQTAFKDEDAERLLTVELDVTSPTQIQLAIDAALAQFSRIDVLVNNAGYGQLGQFEEICADAIQAQFATNVFGLMHVTRAVLPVMRKQRHGHLLNVSSIGGMAGFAGASVYCASKFAVAGFSASLALELEPFGIHVTSVLPGFFRTDFLDSTSVRYGDKVMGDYAAISSSLRTEFDSYNHNQPGDPSKLAEALIAVVESPTPPTHFVVGSDAVSMATDEMDRIRSDIDGWRSVSEDTAQ